MKLKRFTTAALLALPLLSATLSTQVSAAVDSTEQAQPPMTEQQKLQALWDGLEPQRGKISLPRGGATLDIPDGYAFYDEKDAKTLLVDIWGNPPSPVMGIIMPTGEGNWAVTIDYTEDGHILDEDAKDINYDDLLVQMKDDTRESSKYRVEQGYESVELIGWASAPFYDDVEKKLHWAKEINFGGAATNNLNYDIRVLGRKGYLEMSFLAGMSDLDNVKQSMPAVLAMAEFDRGSRYSDFDPDIDEVAAYGIGALVAGKVLAKTGFLAVALLFLKKFWIYILIGLGALGSKLFSRKKEQQEEA